MGFVFGYFWRGLWRVVRDGLVVGNMVVVCEDIFLVNKCRNCGSWSFFVGWILGLRFGLRFIFYVKVNVCFVVLNEI